MVRNKEQLEFLKNETKRLQTTIMAMDITEPSVLVLKVSIT